MAVTILVFMTLGCVLEGLPAIVLMAPIMFPIAKNLGINDIHYSMVVVTAMNIGLMTPPIGIGFYIACKIGNVSPDDAMGAIWPYLLALIVGLVFIAAIPAISTAFVCRRTGRDTACRVRRRGQGWSAASAGMPMPVFGETF